MRRRICLSLLVGGLACGALRAQTSATGEAFKPYLEVKTVAGEERVVRIFFSPACQYSRSYLNFFRNLELTLPQEKKFRMSPLVNTADGIGYAMAYMAVQRYYPEYVNNFVEASLIGVQDRNISTQSWSGLERLAKAARVPVPIGKLVETNFSVLQADVAKLIQVQADLKITNTPAVAVVGTYIVTPEFTNGDPQLFSKLVNGLISMAR